MKKSTYLTTKIFLICLLISYKSDNIKSTTNDPPKIKPFNFSSSPYIDVLIEIVWSSIRTSNSQFYRLYESVIEDTTSWNLIFEIENNLDISFIQYSKSLDTHRYNKVVIKDKFNNTFISIPVLASYVITFSEPLILIF